MTTMTPFSHSSPRQSEGRTHNGKSHCKVGGGGDGDGGGGRRIGDTGSEGRL